MLTLSRWSPVTVQARHRAVSAAIAIGAIAAALVVHLINPSRTHWLPGCPLHELTGLWCPICGSTRSSISLSHGNVIGAFRHNVLFLPTLALLVWLWAAFALRSFVPAAATSGWTRNPLSRLRHPQYLLAVPLVFFILRNIPGVPMHLLSR